MAKPELESLDAFVAFFQKKCNDNYLNVSALEHALDNLCTIQDGWVAEFGVAGGRSLKTIRARTPAHVPVMGFDCFTGLPEAWRPGYDKGEFSSQGKIPDIADNCVVVKGIFSQTLPPLRPLLESRPARFIHVDCDLYSSTVDVFTHCEKSIVAGTVLVFDELLNYETFEQHEIKAFYEFILRTGHEFNIIGIQCANSQPCAVVVTK